MIVPLLILLETRLLDQDCRELLNFEIDIFHIQCSIPVILLNILYKSLNKS